MGGDLSHPLIAVPGVGVPAGDVGLNEVVVVAVREVDVTDPEDGTEAVPEAEILSREKKETGPTFAVVGVSLGSATCNCPIPKPLQMLIVVLVTNVPLYKT